MYYVETSAGKRYEYCRDCNKWLDEGLKYLMSEYICGFGHERHCFECAVQDDEYLREILVEFEIVSAFNPKESSCLA